MKYLKTKLLHASDGSLIYPPNYQVEIGNFAKDHLYYDEGGEDYLLLAINDSDYSETMLKENVTLIEEGEATVISEAKETRTETIKDEAKVRRLEILSRLGMTLSKKDQDALDPTKPDSVFGVSKILADRITDLKVIESDKIK
jgi:hypothetical protein